jgi:hypothetical protein
MEWLFIDLQRCPPSLGPAPGPGSRSGSGGASPDWRVGRRTTARLRRPTSGATPGIGESVADDVRNNKRLHRSNLRKSNDLSQFLCDHRSGSNIVLVFYTSIISTFAQQMQTFFCHPNVLGSSYSFIVQCHLQT